MEISLFPHHINNFFFLQTEYVAPWFKRRAFISGLTGSAGNTYFLDIFAIKNSLSPLSGKWEIVRRY